MTMSGIERWLQKHKLENLSKPFLANKVDIDTLPHLLEENLKEMGLLVGLRKKVLNLIAAIKPKPTQNTENDPTAIQFLNMEQLIKIQKLVIKGGPKDPQVLLVIGTTRITGDLWVHLGFKRTDCAGLPPNGSVSELAAIIFRKGAGAPEPDTAYCHQSLGSYYGIECEEGEALWVARFDFSDHRRSDQDNDLPGLWRRFSASASEGKKLLVSAWCTTIQNDWREKDGEPPSPACIGDSVTEEVPFELVENGKLFELGIILIHGIGPHKARETLTKFGEPILKFLKNWLERVTTRSCRKLTDVQRECFHACFIGRAGRNRRDHEGITHWMAKFRSSSEAPSQVLCKPGAEGVGSVLCGGVQVEDTVFNDSNEKGPNSSLLRVSVVGDDGKLREAHILMSEAWWAKKTVYPSESELFEWMNIALPTIFRMHFAHSIMPYWRDFKTYKNFSRQLFTLPILTAMGLITVCKLPFMVLMQSFLYCLGIFSLIPITRVKRFLRVVIDVLMGTVGQSYALETSLIRQSAIVRQVSKDLEWLESRCEELVVIAHSQGAEISRLLFQARRWPNVIKWITFGAGIKPLNLLTELEANTAEAKAFQNLFRVSSLSTLFLATVWGVRALIGEKFSVLQLISSEGILFFWMGLMALAVVIYIVLCVIFHCFEPKKELSLSKSGMEIWHNYYATHDPVSCGSLFERFSAEMKLKKLPHPKENCIHNLRSTLRDHTSYLQNIEQFVGPITLEIVSLLGFTTNKEVIQKALKEGSERREKTTWYRMICGYMAVPAFLLLAARPAVDNWKIWLNTASAAWQSREGFFLSLHAIWSSGLIRAMVADLWVALAFLSVYWIIRPAVTRHYFLKSERTMHENLSRAFDLE
jgi:hypothetical protein